MQKFKKDRNENAVNSSLDKLTSAAQTNENLMPLIIEAVKTHATIGEISDRLRTVFDEYKG